MIHAVRRMLSTWKKDALTLVCVVAIVGAVYVGSFFALRRPFAVMFGLNGDFCSVNFCRFSENENINNALIQVFKPIIRFTDGVTADDLPTEHEAWLIAIQKRRRVIRKTIYYE
jgi:hypothetical protein